MSITAQQLGERLRLARETSGLSQEIVSTRLGIPRPALSQLEHGHRSVTGLELDQLAYLYGRDIRDFLAGDFAADDVITALFRVMPELDDGGEGEALRKCIALWRAIANLERQLGIQVPVLAGPSVLLATPTSKREAILQGERVAADERRRLGLGTRPVGDIIEWLEQDGIRTACVRLPDKVSGLTLRRADLGVFIAVNRDEGPARRRFSLVHEYGHVVMDSQISGMVSRTNERDTVIEVRANAFAAAFLLPPDGVRALVASIGKQPLPPPTALFDEAEVVNVGRSGSARSPSIHMYDVVHVAHHFAVSRPAAIYRLGNLGFISPSERTELLEQDRTGDAAALAKHLRLEPTPPPLDGSRWPDGSAHRFLLLGLEAVRRGVISAAKFAEIARLVDLKPHEVDELVTLAGLGDEPLEVLPLPGRK